MSRQKGSAFSNPLLICGLTALALVVVALNLRPLIVPLLDQYQRDIEASAIVSDAEGKPMPNVSLRFRNKNGHVVYVYRTNGAGEFRINRKRDLSSLSIDGFVFASYQHNTGGYDWYQISPPATHEFTVYAANGNPYGNQLLKVGLAGKEFTTDANGKLIFPNEPACLNLPVAVESPVEAHGTDRAVASLKRTVLGDRILYEVHLGKSATLTGKLSPPASPSPRYEIVCQDATRAFNPFRIYAEDLPARGDFRLPGINPGTYKVRIDAPTTGEIVYQRTITLKAGETLSLGTLP